MENSMAQAVADTVSSEASLLEGTPFEALKDMSIEDLMNIKITVASKTALTQRESPAIVSVITDADIKSLGARDMMDVLRLVPGITFNQDVTGLVSWSMRGNWGNEGKILLMVDGQEMNEIAFASNYFGNRFDISQIKRIEVIRGPGSSIYGGYAELGVVHIITKDAEQLNGLQVAGTYGQLSDTYARQNLSISGGKDINGVKVTLAAYLSKGQRGNLNYTDLWGNTSSMKGNSNLNNNQLNLGIKYKGLSIRTIAEQYNTTTLSNYDYNPGYGAKVSYGSWVNEVKYDFKVGEKLTITPKVNSNFFQPYALADTSIGAYVVNFNRTTAGVHANYDLNDHVNIIGGAEYFVDFGKNSRPQDSGNYYKNDLSVSYRTFSAYGQTLVKTKIVNFTAGIKAISHEVFGAAFAPRLGFTKTIGNFHSKLLFNRAFRTPTIDNLKANEKVKPEITDVIEFEAGYKIGAHMIVSANVFDITITDPIVYYVPSGSTGTYDNFARSGTRGIEAEFRYQTTNWFVGGNYSFYTVAGKNRVDLYKVDNNPNQNLGNPQHKINLMANFKFAQKFYVAPTVTFLSGKSGFTTLTSDTTVAQSPLPSNTIINLSLGADNIVKGLDIQLMAFNLLDTKISYVQPYGSKLTPGLAPMPGLGREFVIRLTYRINAN
jgi:outer membrane cobalamin receptor